MQKDDKYMLEIAAFTGKVEEALTNQKGDINALFSHNREIIKTLTELKTDMSNLKLKVMGIAAILGAIGAFSTNIFMVYIKGWLERGGN